MRLLVFLIAVGSLASACKDDKHVTRLVPDEQAERHAASLGNRLEMDETSLGAWKVGDPIDEAALRGAFAANEPITAFAEKTEWLVQMPQRPQVVAKFHLRSGGLAFVECHSRACRVRGTSFGVGSEYDAVKQAYPQLACVRGGAQNATANPYNDRAYMTCRPTQDSKVQFIVNVGLGETVSPSGSQIYLMLWGDEWR